ncbi:DNA topoisomerase IB [Xylophilus sp. GOD-11R]|uniref:DNA topoisomerase IB n=1 Tax=Xylophilus sp. GOD-11R TaxID=3089814 RepID=UPI00298C3CC8|nr:DNA topoisomerase IB [Xylophilus sp. GOD-11R]WPB56026.1 DNA topoisomerase IB [Xylophilus sp. GOD-11R]
MTLHASANASTSDASTVPAPAPLPGGLLYVSPLMPGMTRVRSGKRFAYRRVDGARVSDPEEIRRIDSLAIPPAYSQVWICPLANGHLQATGLDARGRRQYRYHPQWRLLRDEGKFERIEAFGRALPKIRARVARDLRVVRGKAPSRTVVLATLVRLLDTTYLRVGNEEYAESNGSYGLTTLRSPHAGVRGSVLTLKFRGKSGVMQEVRLDDPKVARVVRGCQQLPGQELFQYEDEEGEPHRLGSSEVNDYLREAAGQDFTAKDFRTWHGTVQALELTRLACGGHGEAAYSAKAVLAEVARQLGNTPAVCKKSYVHPAVLEVGSTLARGAESDLLGFWQRVTGKQKTPRRLHVAEHRLLGFLREHRKNLRRELRRQVKKTA